MHESTYFNNDKTPKDNYELGVNSSGNLYFKFPDSQGNIKKTDEFGIKAIGYKRPGDDITLRFGILGQENLIIESKVQDFFAVYDKNFLDNANQYIDESIDEEGEATGIIDWNGDDQIDIRNWRRFNDGKLVQNAVAYGWGCYDSVDQFSTEVEILDNLSENVNTWYDYKFPSLKIKTHKGVQYYTPDGENHSVPGFTTYSAFGDQSQAMNVFKDKNGNALDPDGGILDNNNEGDKNYNWDLNAVGSGTDCSGFVSRCALLSGTSYKIVDIDDNLTEEKEGTSTLSNKDYAWLIENENLIVPGDIIVKPGHVAIVLDVKYLERSRSLGAEYWDKVMIIHSTSGPILNKTWRVMSTDKWSILGSTYLPRRLSFKKEVSIV